MWFIIKTEVLSAECKRKSGSAHKPMALISDFAKLQRKLFSKKLFYTLFFLTLGCWEGEVEVLQENVFSMTLSNSNGKSVMYSCGLLLDFAGGQRRQSTPHVMSVLVPTIFPDLYGGLHQIAYIVETFHNAHTWHLFLNDGWCMIGVWWLVLGK